MTTGCSESQTEKTEQPSPDAAALVMEKAAFDIGEKGRVHGDVRQSVSPSVRQLERTYPSGTKTPSYSKCRLQHFQDAKVPKAERKLCKAAVGRIRFQHVSSAFVAATQ